MPEERAKIQAAALTLASLGLAIGMDARELGEVLGTKKRKSEGGWALEWFGDGRNQEARVEGAYAVDAYSNGTFTVSTWPGDGLIIHEGKARKGRKGINHAKNAAEIWLSQNRDRLADLAADAEAKEVQR